MAFFLPAFFCVFFVLVRPVSPPITPLRSCHGDAKDAGRDVVKNFPKSSPDLNHVENVWAFLRQKLEGNAPTGRETRGQFLRRLSRTVAGINKSQKKKLLLGGARVPCAGAKGRCGKETKTFSSETGGRGFSRKQTGGAGQEQTREQGSRQPSRQPSRQSETPSRVLSRHLFSRENLMFHCNLF